MAGVRDPPMLVQVVILERYMYQLRVRGSRIAPAVGDGYGCPMHMCRPRAWVLYTINAAVAAVHATMVAMAVETSAVDMSPAMACNASRISRAGTRPAPCVSMLAKTSDRLILLAPPPHRPLVRRPSRVCPHACVVALLTRGVISPFFNDPRSEVNQIRSAPRFGDDASPCPPFLALLLPLEPGHLVPPPLNSTTTRRAVARWFGPPFPRTDGVPFGSDPARFDCGAASRAFHPGPTQPHPERRLSVLACRAA